MPLNASRYALRSVDALTRASIVWLMIAEYPLHRNNSKLVLACHHTEFVKTKRQGLT